MQESIAQAGTVPSSSLVIKRGSTMLKIAYVGIMLFTAAYFGRPQDYVYAIGYIPLGKIFGLLTGVALVLTLLSEGVKVPREGKILFLMFCYMALCIPTSAWPGGSFGTVIIGFSKIMVVALATMVAVTSLAKLRRIIAIQTLAILLSAAVSVTLPTRAGRLYGAGSLFEDPNDFALALCIILPFCIGLMISARNTFSKVFWAGGAGLALLAIVMTGSRGGFLALVALLFAIWRGFKVSTGRAIGILLLLLVLGGAAVVIKGPAAFVERMSTIIHPETDPTGSAMVRREILKTSVILSLKHPVFGVGPGQFVDVGGFHHQTHNTYTQLSSEAGIASLVLFVMLMRSSFKRIKEVRLIKQNKELWALGGALYCSLIGYMVGSFFLSTAYHFYPYMLMAYCIAAQGLLAALPAAQPEPAEEPESTELIQIPPAPVAEPEAAAPAAPAPTPHVRLWDQF